MPLSFQSHRAQVDRASHDGHQPDPEGESEEVLPRQEVHAQGPARQEDEGDASRPHEVRGLPQDEETAEETEALPHEEVCSQGLRTSHVVANKPFSLRQRWCVVTFV